MAVLLPDATVLFAGELVSGGSCDARGEVYWPPYFFAGFPRPVISSAPSVINYGQSFVITRGQVEPFLPGKPVPVSTGTIAQVNLVRLAAVTHSFDQNQRFVPLTISGIYGSSDLRVNAPSNPNEAPPGYYMLFIVSDVGAPSKAKYVQIMPQVGP